MEVQNTQNIKFIKSLISKTNYGLKTTEGIRPSLTKKSIKNNFKKTISKKLILDHWFNKQTLYYYGNENENENFSLIMIDIDVNKKEKKGSFLGAKEFANLLKAKLGNFYTEPSTNGEGIHGYLILDKCKKKSNHVNAILKEFESWLEVEKEKNNANIEMVEIKGTLHEIEYKNKKISNIKFGTLAKIPRNIKEFIKYKNKNIKIHEIEKNFSIKEKSKKKTSSGSISKKHINKEELSKLKEYEKISKKLFGNEEIKAGKFSVLHKDIAIFLMLLNFFNKNKNEDNSMPTKRAMMLWKKLYECEDEVDRAWNHHRWKKIRDLFSEKGLIYWIDNKYYFGDKSIGEKGIACKWEVKKEVYMYLKKPERKKRASLVDTNPSKYLKISDIKCLFEYKIPILCFSNHKNDYLYDLNKVNDYINKNFCYF